MKKLDLNEIFVTLYNIALSLFLFAKQRKSYIILLNEIKATF